MKKIIFSLALLFLISSSSEPQPQKRETQKTKIQTEELINNIDIHDLEILEIDNCEYIFYKKSPSTNKGFGFMAHKGNCKNPIHYYSRTKVN